MSPVLEPTDVVEIDVEVNGEDVHAEVPARLLLVDLLRERLHLTGTVVGCEHGVCGACTVLLDEQAVRSCIALAVQANGRRVTTVEGVTPRDGLNPLQQSLSDHHGLQCGFCTPGFTMTLSGVDPNDYPDEAAIRELLSGNICRCTGYHKIVDAVMAAWERDRA